MFGEIKRKVFILLVFRLMNFRSRDKPMEHSAIVYISYFLGQRGKKITKELVLGVREFREYEC